MISKWPQVAEFELSVQHLLRGQVDFIQKWWNGVHIATWYHSVAQYLRSDDTEFAPKLLKCGTRHKTRAKVESHECFVQLHHWNYLTLLPLITMLDLLLESPQKLWETRQSWVRTNVHSYGKLLLFILLSKRLDYFQLVVGQCMLFNEKNHYTPRSVDLI